MSDNDSIQLNSINFHQIVGMHESELDSYIGIPNNEYSYRVVERDGKSAIVTRDYRPNRINIKLENGKVVGFHFG
jgi:hypothetical protein